MSQCLRKRSLVLSPAAIVRGRCLSRTLTKSASGSDHDVDGCRSCQAINRKLCGSGLRSFVLRRPEERRGSVLGGPDPLRRRRRLASHQPGAIDTAPENPPPESRERKRGPWSVLPHLPMKIWRRESCTSQRTCKKTQMLDLEMDLRVGGRRHQQRP